MKFVFYTISLFLTLTLAVAQSKSDGFYLKSDIRSIERATTEYKNAQTHSDVQTEPISRAKALNIIGIYHDLTGKKDSAIFYYNKSVNLLKGNPELSLKPLINLVSAYTNTGQYKTALRLANKTLELNKKYGNDIYRALIYEGYGVYYLNTNNNNKSVEYLLKAIEILEKEKSYTYLGSVKINLANTYVYANNYAFAADMYEDYFAHYNKDSLSRSYSIALINYSESLISLKRYTEAHRLLQKNLSLFTKNSDIELLGLVYAKLAKIDIDEFKNPGSALQNYEMAYELLEQRNSKFCMIILSEYLHLLATESRYNDGLKLIASFNKSENYSKADIYDQYDYKRAVAKIYAGAGKLKESNTIFMQALVISDSLRGMADDEITQEAQAKFQTKFEQEKNDLLTQKNNALNKRIDIEKRMLYMYVIMSLALLVLILLFLRGYWLKARLQKQTLKSVENEKTIIEQQHQYEQEITNTQKLTIDEKQREVTSMALQLASFYDTVNGIIEKCDNGTFVKMGDVKKDLMGLTRQKDYWNNFETRFNSLNPNFESNLLTHFPALSKNDIQFCALLKLNLSYKEIASLLQISYESAVTKKYRIKKKMGITDDNEFEKIIIEI